MQLSSTLRSLFVETVAALFVLLFLYTALSKLLNFTNFVRSMLHTPVIADYALTLGIIVPLAELVAVVLLFIPRYRFRGLIVSTIMMKIFTAYVAFVLVNSTHLPCTCGGIMASMGWRQHLVFNSIFLLLGMTAIVFSQKRFIRINRSSRTPAKHSRQLF